MFVVNANSNLAIGSAGSSGGGVNVESIEIAARRPLLTRAMVAPHT
jgi:hypothetical protein